MGGVVVGVDPHKASNTLVVIDAEERVLVQLTCPRFSGHLIWRDDRARRGVLGCPHQDRRSFGAELSSSPV